MNLINKIFNRKIAGDTSNIVLPDATGIDNGIEYKSTVNSNVPNGLFNHISDAIQYLQFSVGLYSNTAQYTEGNICKVITKENGHYQIRVFRRNGNNSGSTVANPPIPTTPTTTNGIDCYPVENETEWNTDWDECETGLAYWEFKIEGKTITEAVQSFDNRDSVGATWTKASIQELYDSVKNFRVVYFYNCLITTNNIVKEGSIIKGSFSFENIARYTMKFEYNLDASSFSSCSYNVFNYNSSIKELNSDALYNSVKGNILKYDRFDNIRLGIQADGTSTNRVNNYTYSTTIRQLLSLPSNKSVQGFDMFWTGGSIGDTETNRAGFFFVSGIAKTTIAIRFYSNLELNQNKILTEYCSVFANGKNSLHAFACAMPNEWRFIDGNETYILNSQQYNWYKFLGDTINLDIKHLNGVKENYNELGGELYTPAQLNLLYNLATFSFIVYYFEV